MDFSDRTHRQNAEPRPAVNGSAAVAGHHPTSRRQKTFLFFKIATITLLFSGTILLVALVLSLALAKGKPESRLVDGKKWQVVVIGQSQAPYFGRIKEVNDKYVRLVDIYYFKANQTVQPDSNTNQQQNISLVKLGCEIHGPQDQMVIRRDDVVYWENLKDDGQVAKAISTYKQQNPNGQLCTTPAAAPSSGATTTPTTTPKK
ncbi:MAG: hypothetical protein JWS12_214 [Candidatus Saccharibacteria bacterium]|nr:hypothetical protein [Candidatus Saccharibacteria bacterium]